MSIKTHIAVISEDTRPTFPLLRKWNGHGSATGAPTVVLFTTETRGVRLTGDDPSLIGNYESWINCSHENWEPCSITMTSET